MAYHDRVCGCAVNVQKTFDEYTITGPDARDLREDFIERGYKPSAFKSDIRGFTITENDIIGSFEAVRIKKKLDFVAREAGIRI